MHNSIVYNPAAWLDQFFNDFERSPESSKGNFRPAVDILEEKEDFVLRAELPGVPKENIKIEVKENRLTLSGTKESVAPNREGSVDNRAGEYRYVESAYGTFSRSFELPRNVSGDSIRAEYANGVLTLRIAKAKETLSRTIEIK